MADREPKKTQLEIVAADQTQAEACLPILADSIMGTYFGTEMARSMLKAAQKQRELLVAVENGAVLGFAAVVKRGSFLVFPYLHLLAVKTSQRSRGVGAALLGHLEQTALKAPGYPDRPKVFLLVSHENPDAIRFYEKHGYKRMAAIDDMFGDGDTEFLYMKDLGKKKH